MSVLLQKQSEPTPACVGGKHLPAGFNPLAVSAGQFAQFQPLRGRQLPGAKRPQVCVLKHVRSTGATGNFYGLSECRLRGKIIRVEVKSLVAVVQIKLVPATIKAEDNSLDSNLRSFGSLLR